MRITLLKIRRCIRQLGELLFPESCVVCGNGLFVSPRVFGAPLCRNCFMGLDRAPQEGCSACGAPVAPEIEYCLACRTAPAVQEDLRTEDNPHEQPKPDVIGRVHALLLYQGSSSRLISTWKIGSRRALTPLLVTMLAGLLMKPPVPDSGQNLPGSRLVDIPVVPVPARPASRVRRGWNPTGLLAGGLAAEHGVQLLPALRRRNGRQQKSLGREHRFSNIQGSFYLRRRYIGRLPETVIVFDDVLTTGATVAECARVLRLHGVRTVITVVAARDL